jgi:ElaB/YqjD/DUF883 family membrane-anchored ribosome-binding protein
MDVDAAIAKAKQTLQRLKRRKNKTLKAAAGLGEEAQEKVRERFRDAIADAEAELKKLEEGFKK